MKHSRTPLRYAGGKSRAYGFISTYIPFWPKPKRIISPFIGGGSLEVRWANELDIEAFKLWRKEFSTSEFHLSDDGSFKVKLNTKNNSLNKYIFFQKFVQHSSRIIRQSFLNPFGQFRLSFL